jgi:hypothetical protein
MEMCTQAEVQSLSLTNDAPREPIQVGKPGRCFCACCEPTRVLCLEYGPNLTSLLPKATFFAHLNLDSPLLWSLSRAASTVMTPT